MVNNSIYKTLAEKARKGKLLLFVGAGASIGSDTETGLPSGSQLNQYFIEYYKEQDCLSDQSLDRVTEYIEKKRGRKTLIEKLYEMINSVKNPLTTHRLIAELPIKVIVTTNYDELLENALSERGKNCNCITSDSDITAISNNEINVFKIHGSVATKEDDIIITESDYYEKFLLKSNLYIDILKAWLTTHTCLFIGYSLSDVNLKYLFFEISKKIGIENVRGSFYAVQHKPSLSDIEIWEKRGFQIVQEDKNVFIDNLLEQIEFKDIEKIGDGLVSKSTFSIGKLGLDEVKKFENLNAEDGQRFFLMSERKMKHLNSKTGDWMEMEYAHAGSATIQYARVYQDNSISGSTIRLPLVTRNLLSLSSDARFGDNSKLTIRKAQLKEREQLIVDAKTDAISLLPLELDNELSNDTPVIAIRNLEFELLGLKNGQQCRVIIQNEKENKIVAQAILFSAKYNPGRAVVGLNSAFRLQLREFGNDFKLIISKLVT